MSTTDPDATPMRLSGDETKLGYQAHYDVVDGDKARVILNVSLTPSEVSENQPLLDLLWRGCFRWRLWPDQVSADGKYGTAENVSAIEQANVRAFVALHRSGGRPNIFGREDFTYNPKGDVYLCPAGELLRPLGRKDGQADREGKVTTYRAKALSYRRCELRARCTSNKLGRSLTGARPHPRPSRGVRGSRKSPPGNLSLRESATKVAGVGRATFWRGKRMTRDGQI